jgi:growth factor-regulated tyrosine kinase substrate
LIETFVTLHTKLNSAVRAYDKLLEERLSHAAQRTRAPSYSNYYGSYSNQIQPQHQYPAPIATNYAYPQTPIALPLSQPVAQTPVQQEQAYPYPQGQPVQTPAVQHQQPISYAVPPTPQVYHQPATQYYPTFSTAAAVATPQQQPSYQTPVTSVQQQQQSTISPTQGPQQYQQQPYFAPNITSASTSYYNQSSHGTFPNNAPQQPQQPNTLYNKPSVEEAPLIEL